MLVRLLGPVGVFSADGPFRLAGQKERTALAALPLARGRPVHSDRLVAALWGDSPPRTAGKTLQTYIARLRATLGEAIESTAAGYVLTADVDVAAVERLAVDARAASAAGDSAAAAAGLAAALELWAGESLADAAETLWVVAERARLEELRLALAEERVDALLACGQPAAALIPELESMVTEAPLRERRWGQLMLALYRTGRQGDALRAYQRLRTTLAEELGIDPSAELRALQGQVLDQDPALDLPPHATTRSTPGGRLPSGVVTFLLTDIAGSSVMWERSPTAMELALVRHDALIADSVAAHRGWLLKSKGEGDSTFSVFVRATDAVAAAVAFQQRLSTEAWPDRARLRVRAAVVTGEAVERDGDYYGTTVDRAARLRALANGGDVLLARSTADVVVDHLPEGVRLEDLGDHVLEGVSRSEHVWRVVAANEMLPGDELAPPAHVPFPAVLAAATGGPLIGRDGELDRLLRFVEGDGRHLVWVRGDPGVGKTRLVAELARRAQFTGALVLHGRCDEGFGAPYQPFVEALRHWVTNVPHGDVVAAAQHRLAHLVRLIPEVADARTRDAAPGAGERFGVLEAVDELLSNISVAAPLMLVLDDVHWADRSSLLLLRHLARSGRRANLALVATYRDTDLGRAHPLVDTLADLRRDVVAERLELRGLAPEHTAQLLVALGVDLDASRVQRVILETEGNPFFVTEVARHLAVAGYDATTIPEGVREAVGRRLSRLTPTATEALAVGAVIGRDFHSVVVGAAGGPTGEHLLDALDEAVAARVLEEVAGTVGQYRFSHDLIRQTLNSDLSTNRRLRLHWSIGQVIATLHPTDVEAIAFHLTEGLLAGDPIDAAQASVAAGVAASRSAAWDEAAAHHERALSVLDHSSIDAPECRYEALVGLSEARRRGGEFRESRRAALTAVDVARRNGWRTELARAVYQAAMRAWQPNDEALLDEALNALGDSDTLERVLLASLKLENAGQQGGTHSENEHFTARADAFAVTARADRLGDPRGQIAARKALDRLLAGRGATDERLASVRAAATIFDAAYPMLGDVDFWDSHSVAVVIVGTGREAADPEMVADGIRRDTALLATADSPFLRRILLFWTVTEALAQGRLADDTVVDGLLDGRDMTYVLAHWDITNRRAFFSGQLDVAVDQVETALANGAAAFPELQFTLAALHAAGGARQRAQAVSADAWAGGIPWTYGRPRAIWSAAEAAARLGDDESAAKLHPLLVPYDGTMLAPYGGSFVDGSAATSLGQVEMVLGRLDDADAHFRAGADNERRMGYDPFVARTQLWWARLLLMRGHADHDRADALLSDASVAAERLGLGLIVRDAAVIREQWT